MTLDKVQAGLAERYTLERELGRGGMATVYLARDERHHRSVALKVLHPELARALGAQRFLREIEIAANLTHPHILPLYDSGEAAGLLYYAMPYIKGESLRDRLERETQLSVDHAIQITGEVADALAYAHGQGVVHRDIKPENILLQGGHALVADFGIARAIWQSDGGRLTDTGLAVGTVAYMSPEQASGAKQVDGRSDVYSLGCVVYEMLAGEPPYTGPTAQAIITKRFTDPIPSVRRLRPTITPGLDRAITRALATVPADRFPSATEFGVALVRGAAITTDTPASAASTSTEVRVPLVGVKRLLRTGLIVAGAVLGVSLVALNTHWWRRSDPVKVLDPNVVVVAPFRVTSADPSLAYLRDGMVDLLAAKLTGQGGPRASDPRSVLSAWRRASGSEKGEVSPRQALEVAEQLGAGQLIVGNIVGAPGRLTLNASVLTVPNGEAKAEAGVEGPADSLPQLVDQLTTHLLTLGAQEGVQRLSALTSTSLPALRLYLDGQAMYRRGRYKESTVLFGRALDLDSAFALAAVGLLASALRTGEFEPTFRGELLATAGRSRLNARDAAYLNVLLGMTYADTVSYRDLLQRAEGFVTVAPDRAEAFFLLGEVLFNFGEMLGLRNAHERASAAYRRVLELDSTYAPALDNLVFVSARMGDTATVRRALRLYGGIDSLAPPIHVAWRAAVALGDSAALRSIRSGFDTTGVLNLMAIGQISQYDGLPLEDADLAQRTWLRRESRGMYRVAVLAELGTLALNRGRPREASRLAQQAIDADVVPSLNLGPVTTALYWDGDSTAGAAAARQLSTLLSGSTEKDPSIRNLVACALEQWRLAHGQRATARRTIAQLRSAKVPPDQMHLALIARGCAILLDAVLAAAEGRPDAAAALDRLDSLMLTGPPYRMFHQSWNLEVARLKEARGDLQGALAATRRRLYFLAEPMFLSTYLRQEGRLAALTGDKAGAIRAYQHYLALRHDPEPALRPQVEQVQADLNQLLEEPRH